MLGAKGMTLGVIFGNRDFFPGWAGGRGAARHAGGAGCDGSQVVTLTPEQTKLGAVETWQNAVLCGQMLREQKQRIDGVLVCLPNFGDEKGVADALRLSELTCPILGAGLPG